MEPKYMFCLNCLNNLDFKEPSVKMVEVTLELDEDINISNCELCQCIRDFLG
jgi:hypothetical protein